MPNTSLHSFKKLFIILFILSGGTALVYFQELVRPTKDNIVIPFGLGVSGFIITILLAIIFLLAILLAGNTIEYRKEIAYLKKVNST